MEIERKFWIETLPDLPEESCSDVYQGYLCTAPVELRIRKRQDRKTGQVRYQLCVKSIGKLRWRQSCLRDSLTSWPACWISR